MTTVTYHIHHWTDEDTGAGDCFEVVECVTLHVVTGDERDECGIASFGTLAEAQAFVAAL
jgi:hypothetical protein